jgi:hypothetical protein
MRYAPPLPHTTLPGYYPVVVDADVWSLARARSLVRSLRTPAAHHSLSTERNADGRRVHFRMRLGASSRRRKRAPSRSSSTIATAAAASAGHSRFFTSAYYIHRQRRHSHMLTYTYTHAEKLGQRSTAIWRSTYIMQEQCIHIYILYIIYTKFFPI